MSQHEPGALHEPAALRVLVSGASGLIGSELARQLEDAGHTVLRLVRHDPRGGNEFRWDPTSEKLDVSVLDGVDAVVNLSGASLSRLPWTAAYQRELLFSRVQATRTLTTAMRMASSPPSVLLNASAVGFYGDRPGELLTEESGKGTGFLAELVDAWETTARLAPAQTRVVTFRTGVVIAKGGALAPLALLTKFGLGARLGSGHQQWPWISLHDEAAAIVHLLTSKLSGAVNLAGPTPATLNRLMTRVAADLHRPYKLIVPKAAISLTLRQAGHELLLASQYMLPQRLIEDGFEFRHGSIEQAIDAVLLPGR